MAWHCAFPWRKRSRETEDHTLPCYREPHVENTISHRASASARIWNGTVCMKPMEDPEQKAVVCVEKGGLIEKSEKFIYRKNRGSPTNNDPPRERTPLDPSPPAKL
ncbi:hypothetical protein CDAR_110541 [Caerostris darwini]|uniref:Uncharacterized protein n=1 Tax=Caerostris darwini TaxID=1538125 RepID=A0AAV4QH69_9ARAC|nr:hypothetical protein CDAR_110541 [Caerostris darwini]